TYTSRPPLAYAQAHARVHQDAHTGGTATPGSTRFGVHTLSEDGLDLSDLSESSYENETHAAVSRSKSAVQTTRSGIYCSGGFVSSKTASRPQAIPCSKNRSSYINSYDSAFISPSPSKEGYYSSRPPVRLRPPTGSPGGSFDLHYQYAVPTPKERESSTLGKSIPSLLSQQHLATGLSESCGANNPKPAGASGSEPELRSLLNPNPDSCQKHKHRESQNRESPRGRAESLSTSLHGLSTGRSESTRGRSRTPTGSQDLRVAPCGSKNSPELAKNRTTSQNRGRHANTSPHASKNSLSAVDSGGSSKMGTGGLLSSALLGLSLVPDGRNRTINKDRRASVCVPMPARSSLGVGGVVSSTSLAIMRCRSADIPLPFSTTTDTTDTTHSLRGPENISHHSQRRGSASARGSSTPDVHSTRVGCATSLPSGLAGKGTAARSSVAGTSTGTRASWVGSAPGVSTGFVRTSSEGRSSVVRSAGVVSSGLARSISGGRSGLAGRDDGGAGVNGNPSHAKAGLFNPPVGNKDASIQNTVGLSGVGASETPATAEGQAVNIGPTDEDSIEEIRCRANRHETMGTSSQGHQSLATYLSEDTKTGRGLGQTYSLMSFGDDRETCLPRRRSSCVHVSRTNSEVATMTALDADRIGLQRRHSIETHTHPNGGVSRMYEMLDGCDMDFMGDAEDVAWNVVLDDVEMHTESSTNNNEPSMGPDERDTPDDVG
ncbi:hypothetical protein SARC_13062, partial [Sphaeroforma arctica JP610]